MTRYDVVVVGAGTAGIPCAIEAAKGARVLVVDRAAEIGGTLHVSAGHMSGAGSRRQREAGIEDEPQLHYDDVMAIGGGRADPVLVQMAVEEAPRTLDWLDDLGFDFDPATPAVYRGHTPYSRPRTFWGLRKGRSILETMRPLWDEAVDAGRIEQCLSTSVVGLQEGGGRVDGVVLEGASGTYAVESDAVVLCTGGYGSAPDLFDELTPGGRRLVTNAMETSVGDAIRLAHPLGAEVRYGELHTPRLGLIEQPPGSGRVDFWTAMLHLTAAERPPREIWVNRLGQRFVAEDLVDVTTQEHAALAQSGSTMWVVFDDAALDADAPLVRQWSNDELRERGQRGDLVVSADNLEELAEGAGIDPGGLVATVGEFNDGVRHEKDRLGRSVLLASIAEPPFYAIQTPAAVLCTFGGVGVGSDFKVRRDDGSMLDGLYAIGEAIGMGATSGSAFCGGMAVTPALGFGRVLGQTLS